MSLEKNLIKTARKAWRAFTYNLCSNFHNLHLATSSSAKATARRVSDFCSFRLFRRRFHTRGSYNKRRRRRRRRGYEVVEYRSQYGGGKTEEVGEQRSESGPSMEEAWEVVVAAASQLTVDEKAEEFISKFRQEMNLEKEKSLAEFHEMLARGA